MTSRDAVSRVRWRRSLLFLTTGVVLAATLAAGWQWSMDRIGARHFPAPGRMVDVGGRRLHMVCVGSGAPTVILEPSGLGAVLQYQTVQDALGHDMRVCAYDRAGQGWSDPSPDAADARHLADDLDQLLRRSGEALPYLLVASSAGGLTVELYAREHPHDVAGLVMVDALSAAMVRALPEIRRLEKTACQAYLASWFGVPRMLDPLGLRRLPEPARDRAIWLTYRTSMLASACSMTRSFDASAAQIEQAAPLPRALPLIVLSHDDPTGIVPDVDAAELAAIEPRWQEGQRRFANQLSGAQVSVVKSTHLIASERPEAVVAAVRKLLAAQPAAPAAVAPFRVGQ